MDIVVIISIILAVMFLVFMGYMLSKERVFKHAKIMGSRDRSWYSPTTTTTSRDDLFDKRYSDYIRRSEKKYGPIVHGEREYDYRLDAE